MNNRDIESSSSLGSWLLGLAGVAIMVASLFMSNETPEPPAHDTSTAHQVAPDVVVPDVVVPDVVVPDLVVQGCRATLIASENAPVTERQRGLGEALACVLKTRCSAPGTTNPQPPTSATPKAYDQQLQAAEVKDIFCGCRLGADALATVSPEKRMATFGAACAAPLFRRCSEAWTAKVAPDKRREHIIDTCATAYCPQLHKTLAKPLAVCAGKDPTHDDLRLFLESAARLESPDPAVPVLARALGDFLLVMLFEVKVQPVQAPKMGARKDPPQLALTVFIRRDNVAITAVSDAGIEKHLIESLNARVGGPLALPTPSYSLPPEALIMQVTRSAITIKESGETKALSTLALSDFVISPKEKEGGDESSYLIEPVLTTVRAWASRQRDKARKSQRRFNGIVRVLGDGHMPFRTLAELVHTLGMAELSDLRFKQGPDALDGAAPSMLTPDYRSIYKRLAAYKLKFPDVTTINIGSDPQLPWASLLGVIEVSRTSLPETNYPDDKSFRAALQARASSAKDPTTMFPAVVFVVSE